VYRCYDNRLRYSERRPDVYLDQSHVIEGASKYFELRSRSFLVKDIHYKDQIFEPIHLDRIDSLVLNFGQQDKESNKPNWLWTFRGHLLVLSSPHLPGKHYATSPLQLLAAVIQLENFHSNGFFHGDIRAYNILFQESLPAENEEECPKEKKKEYDLKGFQAALIDFDFAGPKHDPSLKYPDGYVQSLPDGKRCGRAGESISLSHELYSMAKVVFSVHTLNPPKTRTAEIKEAMCDEVDLRCKFANINDITVDSMQMLKEFLWKISKQGWTVTLDTDFRLDLEANGLDGVVDSRYPRRTGTNHASGTPEKRSFSQARNVTTKLSQEARAIKEK
jgi:serine/threonine protein kinase